MLAFKKFIPFAIIKSNFIVKLLQEVFFNLIFKVENIKIKVSKMAFFYVSFAVSHLVFVGHFHAC